MQRDELLEEIPTARAAVPDGWQDREAIFRRVGIGVLVVVLVLAAVGAFGPREATTSSPDGSVSVTHPSVTRPGLDSRVVVTIPPGEGGEPPVIEMDRAALEALGLTSFSPEPAAVTSRGERVELEFEPDGDRDVVVTLSGRIPTQAPTGSTRWEIARPGGGRSVTVSMRTWVLP